MMKGWPITKYPTVCSFGFKFLLLSGAMGVLSFAGFLESPSAPSNALSVKQVDASTEQPPQSPPMMVADAGHVDINRGTADDLRRLPGIGPVLAERVIRHRQEHGKFGSIRDIQNVKGIGEKRFAQLEPYIHIDGDAFSSDK